MFIENSQSMDTDVLSVSELNRSIKQSLESEYPLVWVKGEISNFTAHRSGHYYFSLKDKNSQVSAVMFKGYNSKLRFKVENGMEVVVRARVNVYEPRGSYQLNCEIMDPVGAGALQKQFEQLKKKLAEEGLFDKDRKKPLPSFPRKIALVTSPTGAAVRDMINVLTRRFKGIEITVASCLTQGEQAAKDIIRALDLVESVGGFDVIIVGRGGGSIEDLWCFNDELLARRIANCKVPCISAVGHEIDFTIADFVADLRAPTPSAAAELVIKNSQELMERLGLIKRSIWQAMTNCISRNKQEIQILNRAIVDPRRKLELLQQKNDELRWKLDSIMFNNLKHSQFKLNSLKQSLVSPEQVLKLTKQKLSSLIEKLKVLMMQNFKIKDSIRTSHRSLFVAMQSELRAKRSDFVRQASLLDSLSPLRVLDRGYSITKLEQEIIKDVSSIKVGDEILTQFAKGKIKSKIIEIN